MSKVPIVALALIVGALITGLTIDASAQDASAAPSACPSPGMLASMSPETSASPWPSPAAATSASTVAPASPTIDDGCDSVSDPSVAAVVTIEAGDYWFAPSELTIGSATHTTLELVGVGQLAHNLTITDLDLQLYVGPGTSAEVTVSDLPPGTYPFYCAIYGHARAGMVGTLIVE